MGSEEPEPERDELVDRVQRLEERMTQFEQDLYTMNADGTNQTRITDTATGIETDPRWSTAGIAFTANADGTPRLYLINPDGTGLTQLSRGSTPSYEPAWKP